MKSVTSSSSGAREEAVTRSGLVSPGKSSSPLALDDGGSDQSVYFRYTTEEDRNSCAFPNLSSFSVIPSPNQVTTEYFSSSTLLTSISDISYWTRVMVLSYSNNPRMGDRRIRYRMILD